MNLLLKIMLPKIALFIFGTLLTLSFAVVHAEEKSLVTGSVNAIQKALELVERDSGSLSLKAFAYRKLLAGLYNRLGHFEDAAALINFEVEELENAEGQASLRLADSLNRLGDIYREAGRDREFQRGGAVPRDQTFPVTSTPVTEC